MYDYINTVTYVLTDTQHLYLSAVLRSCRCQSSCQYDSYLRQPTNQRNFDDWMTHASQLRKPTIADLQHQRPLEFLCQPWRHLPKWQQMQCHLMTIIWWRMLCMFRWALLHEEFQRSMCNARLIWCTAATEAISWWHLTPTSDSYLITFWTRSRHSLIDTSHCCLACCTSNITYA